MSSLALGRSLAGDSDAFFPSRCLILHGWARATGLANERVNDRTCVFPNLHSALACAGSLANWDAYWSELSCMSFKFTLRRLYFLMMVSPDSSFPSAHLKLSWRSISTGSSKPRQKLVSFCKAVPVVCDNFFREIQWQNWWHIFQRKSLSLSPVPLFICSIWNLKFLLSFSRKWAPKGAFIPAHKPCLVHYS